MWDEMVDVVSVGAGPGGLACAIAAADAGLDVLVVRPPVAAPADPGPGGWLPVVDDVDTMAYFDALCAELPAVTPPAAGPTLPVRPLRDVEVDTTRRAPVPTFVGSRLGAWAAECLATPYGLLFTRVADWPTTTMRTPAGEQFEVTILDEGAAPTGRTFAERIEALAADRQIEIVEGRALQRIVFEEGELAGVMVDSPGGSWAVRARVGIVVTAAHPVPPDDRTLAAGSRIGLVGLKASRFGRVEVLSRADEATVTG